MINDPYLARADKRQHNCCGFAATGDEVLPVTEMPEVQPEPVKTKVMNLQAWRYAKTALAIVGVYVVIKFIYNKLKK